MITLEQLKENLENIENRICNACKRAGRSRDEITLIAVSKMNPAEAVIAALDCGINIFGENKVQELCEKYEQIDKCAEWHLIGHLQRNKVKYIIGKTKLIHSVDSLRLAEEIDKESKKKNVVTDILIEVNAASEESKFGVPVCEAEELIREISLLSNVRICGLMTVAPYTENAEDNRIYFKEMKELSVDINSKNIDNVHMNVLSMGMTGDFETAIEEGATHVRIGTGIFGERTYGSK